MQIYLLIVGCLNFDLCDFCDCLNFDFCDSYDFCDLLRLIGGGIIFRAEASPAPTNRCVYRCVLCG
jgi:hypothetical protein